MAASGQHLAGVLGIPPVAHFMGTAGVAYSLSPKYIPHPSMVFILYVFIGVVSRHRDCGFILGCVRIV